MADNESTSSRQNVTLRGPTKDYREFEGEYRSRNYSIYRIIITNLREMIKSKWAIAILILSYLFLSFNLLGLVFGAAFEEEDIVEMYDILDPNIHYRIEPETGQGTVIPIDLGDQTVISYKVTNIGKDTGQFSTIAFKPNPEWSVSLEVRGPIDLGPGDSTFIDLTVDIPETMENFSYLSETDPFLSLGPWATEGYMVDSEPRVKDEYPVKDGNPGDSYEEGPFPMNTVYSFNRTRAVTLLVAPTDAMESILMEGLSDYDIRLSSASTLFTLDEYWTEEEKGVSLSDLSMSFKDEDNVEIQMRTSERKGKTLVLENHGDSDIHLNLECIQMPITDFSMSCNLKIFLQDDEYYESSMIEITLSPGERREIRFVVNSGQVPIKTSYNFLVIATEVGEDSTYRSAAAGGMVTITGVKSDAEMFGEDYHRMLWGGGFNYERYLWIILLAAFAGSAVISRDIQENSMALYLSKPITWYDYLVSKFSSLILLLSTVTIIPAIILFLTGMAFSSDDIPGMMEKLPIFGGIILSYLIALVIFASVCMAFSTVIKKWILAGVAIFVSFIFTTTISDILRAMFNNDYLKLMNLNLIFKNLFKPLFGLSYNADYVGMEWYVPALFLLGITAICWAIMVFTFRMKEVAK